jgi:hypothetical protein
MRTLLALAVALSAAAALALTAPPDVAACTTCSGALDDAATSVDARIQGRETGHAATPPLRLASRASIAPVHATLDSCGTGDHGLPETATATAVSSPAPASSLPVPLLAVAALLGYAAMLRRFDRRA